MTLQSNKFYNAALLYASLGWKVFPLRAGLKEPATAHGVHDASSDLTQIQKWWTNHPNANVAIACGPASGVYVLDVDLDKTKGTDGYESMKEFRPLPQTVSATTPRGGRHYFFTGDPQKLPTGKIGFRHGLDIKAKGGYVVAAPSVCTEGAGAGGCYKWVEACSPGQIEIPAWPADIHPEVKSPWLAPPAAPVQTPIRTHTASASASGRPDVTQRASSYLATCNAAVQGQDGHGTLISTCRKVIDKFDLSRGEALSLLWREYNPRCIPPWNQADQKDSKDFERKVDEVLGEPSRKGRGHGLVEATVDDQMAAVCDNLLANHKAKQAGQVAEAEKVEEAKDLSELEVLCNPTGYLGQLTGWMNSQALRDQPLMSLGCALTFFGTVFGRKVMDSRRGGRTNIYCMGVAKTSAGKDNPQDCVRRLCHEAGCNDMLSGVGITSDSAIETMLSREPATLMLLDEIGHLLQAVKAGKDHKVGIVPCLMQIYSRANTCFKGRQFADAETQVKIDEPCLSLWGTSTPVRFQDGISPDELADGWLSRCLVFSSDTRPKKNRTAVVSEPPKDLVTFVKWWSDFNERPVVEMEGKDPRPFEKKADMGDIFEKRIFVSTEAAEKVFIDFDDECEVQGNKNEHLGPLWFKAEENARRVALIVAVSNWNDTDGQVIAEEHAVYSCKLIRFLIRSFIRNFAGKMTEGVTDKKRMVILDFVKAAGRVGILKRELARKARNFSLRERDSIIDDLVETGEVLKLPQGPSYRLWCEAHSHVYWEMKNAK